MTMPPGSWRNCGSRALLTSRRPPSATRCTSAPSGSAPHCVAVRRIIRCPFLRSVDLSGFQADANLLTELCGNVDPGVKREAGDTAMQEVVGMELVDVGVLRNLAPGPAALLDQGCELLHPFRPSPEVGACVERK